MQVDQAAALWYLWRELQLAMASFKMATREEEEYARNLAHGIARAFCVALDPGESVADDERRANAGAATTGRRPTGREEHETHYPDHS